MVVGPLERPDEISFKESFVLIELLLVLRSQFFIRDCPPPFDIPTSEVDVVGVEGPTERARMCYRPKPLDGRRQTTREPGGSEPLSVGPVARTCPEVGVHWACHLTYT
jgi:hypothetical protein